MKNRLKILRAERDWSQQDLAERLEVSRQSVNAIDSAVAPTTPSGPNHLLYTLVALIAGLFVAIAVCVLMETLNTKARSSEDVEELLGVPVIGHIPAVGER